MSGLNSPSDIKTTAGTFNVKSGSSINTNSDTSAHGALHKNTNSGQFAVVSGGTDTHLVLVDLRPKKLTGKAAERSLENAGITCNKNGVPFDPESPFVTSGIRLGSPAGTSRGFGENEFREIGNLIGDVLDGLSQNPDDNSKVESEVKLKVKALCDKFPIYSQAI